MKKKLIDKIIQASRKPGWKLQNYEVTTAASAAILIDACRIVFLSTEKNLLQEFLENQISTAKQSELDELISKYVDLDADTENPGLDLFHSSWKDLEILINEDGEDEELVDVKAKEKMEAILLFYPKYQWLKQNQLDIKSGKESFTQHAQLTKEAFEAAKIQGSVHLEHTI